MGQILVRNLDDSVIARIKSSAQLNGTSMEAEARRLLEMSITKHGPSALELSRELRKDQTVVPSLSTEDRREGLE